MLAGPGIERDEGMLGFDWVTHGSDPGAVDADMNFTGLLPPDLDNIRDRFDNVEGLSGWDGNDILRGDDADVDDAGADHKLTNAGSRSTGPAGDPRRCRPRSPAATSSSAATARTTIEGRGGDDIIDGDRWLNARISVRSRRRFRHRDRQLTTPWRR